MKLAVDLGTTFSTPATVWLDTNIILLPAGKYGIPSLFYYDEWEGILVGEAAEDAGCGADARNLKREVKMELYSSFELGGKTFCAKEIVSHILKHITDTAMQVADTKLINEPLEGVVISVPAAFEHNEKEIIRQAAELPLSKGGPGLKVLGFIKEPVAAALSYFNVSLKDETRVLIYDLGGGTFDVAIVEADSTYGEKYKVIDSDMLRIGGKDWDEKLGIFIAREVEKQTGVQIWNNPAYKEKIKRAAISAKHALSERQALGYRDKVRTKVEVNGLSVPVVITREMFDEMTADLFRQTTSLVRKILEKSGRGVSKIVCVGGSCNMPQVTQGLKREFPDMEIQVFEPEKAIATGAAIYAKMCGSAEKRLSDIAAYSYGIRCYEDYDRNPDRRIIVNLIRKGDRLPMTAEHHFMTVEEDQRRLKFAVFESTVEEGECELYQVPEEPVMQVELELPPNTPKNTDVCVKMTLTGDGIIEVEADDAKGHTCKGRKVLNY